MSAFVGDAFDALPQLLHVHGLGDIVIHTGGQIFFPVTGHGVGCHGDNGNIRAVTAGPSGPDGPGGIHAVYHRHLHVHYHEVEIFPLQELQGLLAVDGPVHGMAVFFEHALAPRPGW